MAMLVFQNIQIPQISTTYAFHTISFLKLKFTIEYVSLLLREASSGQTKPEPDQLMGDEYLLLFFTFSHDLGIWGSHLYNLPLGEGLTRGTHRISSEAQSGLP